jgi:hypothetical protein
MLAGRKMALEVARCKSSMWPEKVKDGMKTGQPTLFVD